jgi:hypothetical protein
LAIESSGDGVSQITSDDDDDDDDDDNGNGKSSNDMAHVDFDHEQ